MKFLVFVIFCAITTIAATFPNLKIGDSSPISSTALLEVNSTAKGVLVPRVTSTQRNAILNPAQGLMVYDTTFGTPCQRNSAMSSWTCNAPMSTTSFPLTNNRLLVTSSSAVIQLPSSGTAGQVLLSGGTNSIPTWGASGSKDYWSGSHGTNCSWTTASGTLVDPAIDASCTFSTKLNNNFGTVVSANDGTLNNNLPGIKFTPNQIGVYYACATFGISNDTSSDTTYAALTDGTNIFANSNHNTTSGNFTFTEQLCGIVPATTLSTISLRIKIAAPGAGNTSILTDNGNRIDWTIFQL